MCMCMIQAVYTQYRIMIHALYMYMYVYRHTHVHVHVHARGCFLVVSFHVRCVSRSTFQIAEESADEGILVLFTLWVL